VSEAGTPETAQPRPAEADERAFKVLEAIDGGRSLRTLKVEFGIGQSKLAKIRTDEALRARWVAYKAAVKAWEDAQRRRAICETVLETGNMAEAARRHGVTNVTVMECLRDAGLLTRIRELRRVQAEFFGYTVMHQALRTLPAMADLALNQEAAAGGRAMAGDVVRKFHQGGDPTTINVANAPGGVAVAGNGAQTALALPKPPSEQDLPQPVVHKLARLLLESEPGGTANPGGDDDDDDDGIIGRR